MRMRLAFALTLCLVTGPAIKGAGETTKVLYTAPLGTSESLAGVIVDWRASVVNLDTTAVTVTVSFCDLNGNCLYTNNATDCVQKTLSPQRGCQAGVVEFGGFRYARIELTTTAKEVVATGQLSAKMLINDSDVLATVTAH